MNREGLIVLLGCAVLVTTGHGLIAPVFAPVLAQQEGGTQLMAWMFAAFAAGQLVSAPLLGRWADHGRRRLVMRFGLLAVLVTNFAYVFVDEPSGWIALRAIHGGLSAGVLPAALALALQGQSGAPRQNRISMFSAASGAGIAFGPLIGGVLTRPDMIWLPFAVSAVVAGAALAATFGLGRDGADSAERASVASSPLELLRRVGVSVLGLQALISASIAWIEPVLTMYLFEYMQMSPALIGVTFAVYGATIIGAQVVVPRIVARLGAPKATALGFALQTVALAGCAAMATPAHAIALAVVMGAGAALIFPCVATMTLARVPHAEASSALGLKESVAAAGLVGGPLLAVFTSASFDPRLTFLGAAAAMSFGIAVSISLQGDD